MIFSLFKWFPVYFVQKVVKKYGTLTDALVWVLTGDSSIRSWQRRDLGFISPYCEEEKGSGAGGGGRAFPLD